MDEPGIEKTAPTAHLLAHRKKCKAQEAGKGEQRTSLERQIHCPLPQSKPGDKLQRATCTIKAKASKLYPQGHPSLSFSVFSWHSHL